MSHPVRVADVLTAFKASTARTETSTVSQLDQSEFVFGGRNICCNVLRDAKGMDGHLSVHL